MSDLCLVLAFVTPGLCVCVCVGGVHRYNRDSHPNLELSSALSKFTEINLVFWTRNLAKFPPFVICDVNIKLMPFYALTLYQFMNRYNCIIPSLFEVVPRLVKNV